MEKNSNDEMFEFPENYEDIANQALLNFEKNCKFDLNQLIQKGLKLGNDDTNIKENIIENNTFKNKTYEWEDFESDENEENKIENNNYQAFEDEKEEYEIYDQIKNKQINEDYKEKNLENNITYSKIEINKKKEEDNSIYNKTQDKKNEIDKNIKEKLKENDKIKENNFNKKQKLKNKEMKDLISKINFSPPNWAINLNDEDFIEKAKKYINSNK